MNYAFRPAVAPRTIEASPSYEVSFEGDVLRRTAVARRAAK